ncbi:MAG TPA: hypothetical protein ENN99_02595, partial [Chloroflexi bacterium]|nr:hypothetical protein [Chloroflexota bacterium]
MPAGVTVKLEDQAYAIVATCTTDMEGFYIFKDLTVLGQGFNVLFAQAWNEQYSEEDVVSWAWIGPFAVARSSVVELPDFEIGQRDFVPINPPMSESFSVGEISAQNPILFEWNPYPGAESYWVDLSQGDDLTPVWHTQLLNTTSAVFDRVLDNGSLADPDTYWWGVGARGNVG